MNKGKCVTKGRENIIAARYKEISDIIKKNSNERVEIIVKNITGASRSAWYKSMSKGPRRGMVSNLVIAKLAKFSGLSEDIFSGKSNFSAEDKKTFADKIKEKFSGNKYSKKYKRNKIDIESKEDSSDKKENKAAGKDESNDLNSIKAKRSYIKSNKYSKNNKITEKDKSDGFKSAVELAEMPSSDIEQASTYYNGSNKNLKPEPLAAVSTDKNKNGAQIEKLKDFASEIENLNDIKKLETISIILEKLSKITEKKIDLVSALEEL